ncbi:MAG: cytochrome P450 [Pseudomonadota bacterium]
MRVGEIGGRGGHGAAFDYFMVMEQDLHSPLGSVPPGAVLQGAGVSHLPVRPRHVSGQAGLMQAYAMSQRNLLELIPWEAFSESVISGANPSRFHLVMAPDLIRRILQTRVEDYPKSDLARSILRPAIGDSMLVADGKEWRRQRRAAAPVFQPRNIDGLGPVMSAAAERAAARVAAQVGRAADLLDEVTTATFEVISDVTFSGEAPVSREVVFRGMEAYAQAQGKMSFLDVLGAPEWIPRPARLRPDGSVEEMKAHAAGTVAERRDRSDRVGKAPDLLDLLVRSDDLNDTDIRDNLLAFIVAGHETTALTLAWALYLLGFDEEAQARAHAEAQDVLKGRVAGIEDVSGLPFIRAVIDETLRLYPPAGFLSRMAREQDELGGSTVLPGDTVSVPVYAVHRHKALWEAPDAFRPDRFLGKSPAPRYAYLPFGDGPRICIGARFALQEAIIILATLISRFRFRAVPGKVPEPTLIITLRPEGGVWLEVEAV